MNNNQFDNRTRQRVNRVSWWNVLKRLFAGFLVLMLLPKAGTVHAANNWLVTKPDDTNDGVCAPTDCSLREAIAAAASGDTITVPPGIYQLTFEDALAVPPIYPHLFIRKSLSITGSGVGSTIIQQTKTNFRVFDIGVPPATPGGPIPPQPIVIISRMTVMGGHAVPSNSEAYPGHIHGGGIHNHAILYLWNVTITGNDALSDTGGGIYSAGSGASATLINVTIKNNTAQNGGGGIANGGTVVLKNTIIAGNSPANCSGTITSDGNNNLQFPGTTCGGAIPEADPLLGALTNGVYPLLAGSVGNPNPAIDAGATGVNSLCPGTDQLGNPRPQDGNGDGLALCDIGAFEIDGTPPVIVANVATPPNANGWNNTDVTVTWNVSDPESGIASSSECGTTTLTGETAGTMLTCSATNVDGFSSSESVTVKIDKTPPTVTYAGNAGVYTVDQTVNITCSAADNLSGVDSTTCADISGPASSFGLGTHIRSATATDNAGNVGSGSTTFTVVEAPSSGGDTTGVFRPINGIIFLKNSHSSGFADIALNYGIPGDYPVTGDWDGNGTATIGVYRNGSFYLRNANTVGFADVVFAFGQPGDQPIAGDWNGDGVDTIGVYRPSIGQFMLRNSNSAGAVDISFFLGNVGDVGIAGDWNGDGMDTTGVFRPVNGIIFLKNTNDTGFADVALNYGIPGDQPIIGDWDNNGIDTIGVYRNGRFFLRNANTIGFADIVFDLGNPGDMPIAGNWDGVP